MKAMNGIVFAGHWAPNKRRRLGLHQDPGLEIIYVAQGRMRWQVEGKLEVVPPGSLHFSLPWQIHGSPADAEPGSDLYYVVFRLDREYQRPPKTFQFHRDLAMPPDLEREIVSMALKTRRHTHAASPEAAWLISRIVHEQNGPHYAHSFTAVALGRALLVELVRSIRRRDAPAGSATVAERRVRTFLQKLPGRCAEPWTLEAMGNTCGLSRTRFSEIVRKQTGDPPIMFLNRSRVLHAQELLRDTDRTVTEIVLDCGFSSSQYFARVFKEYTGVNARSYRRRAQVGG